MEALEGLMEALKDLKKQHNLTQLQVAERMGRTQSFVSQLERYDANPTLSTIRQYALAVGARLNIEVIDDLPSPRSVSLTLVCDQMPSLTIKEAEPAGSWPSKQPLETFLVAA